MKEIAIITGACIPTKTAYLLYLQVSGYFFAITNLF